MLVSSQATTTSTASVEAVDAAEAAPLVDLHKCLWTDFILDKDGKVVALYDKEIAQYSLKELHFIGSALRMKGIHNTKKAELVDQICHYVQNQHIYKALGQQQGLAESHENEEEKKKLQLQGRRFIAAFVSWTSFFWTSLPTNLVNLGMPPIAKS